MMYISQCHISAQVIVLQFNCITLFRGFTPTSCKVSYLRWSGGYGETSRVKEGLVTRHPRPDLREEEKSLMSHSLCIYTGVFYPGNYL